jgi:phosphate:Na+ symporter
MTGTEVLANTFGSIGLLLWGIRMVRTGMTRAFGASLRREIGKRTRTRGRAFLVGMVVTSVLQSSTATALLFASFAGTGLIALPMALSGMLGADLGSALMAQLFSFNVKWLWSILVPAGAFTFLASQSTFARAIARISLGLGFMLLSLSQLGTAVGVLRDSEVVRSLMGGLGAEPIIGFIIAFGLTWLFHSSLSVILLIASLASTNLLPLPLALAMVLGVNVGGALTPLSSLANSPVEMRRIPIGNLVMRATVALVILVVLQVVKPQFPGSYDNLGEIAIGFHILFNLIVAILFLPLVGKMASLMSWLVADPTTAMDLGKPRYLDPFVIKVPTDALACAMRETLNLGDQVATMLQNALRVFENSDLKLAKEVERADNFVDALHHEIKIYLVGVSKATMSDDERRRYAEILNFTTNLEHIGDIIDKNLMELAAKKIKGQYSFSAEGFEEIKRFHAGVSSNMQLAFNVLATRDVTLARRLFLEKVIMRDAELAAAENHYARLRDGRPESIESSPIHLDLIRDLKRINDHLTAIAYPMLDAVGALRQTRLFDDDVPLVSADGSVTQIPDS